MYGVRMRERPPGMVGHHGLLLNPAFPSRIGWEFDRIKISIHSTLSHSSGKTDNGKRKTENREQKNNKNNHRYHSEGHRNARHEGKYIIAMADMDLEHSGLQEVANAMREENANMSNTAQKRKRDSESADDTRRLNNKRVSASSGNDSGDQSLVNQQIGDVEALQNYANLQHNQQIHPDHQNGAADHANASSTAAAALAGIYPTMTIPQPTDVLSLLKHLRTIATKTRLSWITASNLTIASWTIRNSNINLKVEVLLPNQSWDLMNGTRFERTITKKLSDVAAKQSTKDQFCKELSNSSLSSRRTRLKNIEKWTLEKLLTEQAIAELSASNDKLKTECERAWREVETWKKTCQSAGLAPKKEDAGTSEKLDEVLRMLGGLLLHCWSQLR
ncbi:hypothetical protein EYC84_007006 [Monilinia fructicola]|uniref:Uncharacterized protein n=1 Tax=Monilinia fructicola TaxID=38448 RepID=A0A5M9K7Y2_MONFR|nr:hypothetical protein EYC84_007006 [Monilinia fructicola]